MGWGLDPLETFLAGPPPAAASSISPDFGLITAWLSHELAQEIAFNAGSAFDPPRELISRHIQPDVSFGVGKMPLDKKKFPTLESSTLNGMNVSDDQALDPESSYTLPSLISWMRKTGVKFTGAAHAPADCAALVNGVAKSKKVSSSTKEITYDYGRGLLMVDSPRTQGFSGFAPGAPLTLSGCPMARSSASASEPSTCSRPPPSTWLWQEGVAWQ